MAAKWAQKTVVIPAQRRGCHLITPKVLKEIESDLAEFKCGLAHFFLQHTSASLTINENYDSDVQADTETFLNRIVPEGRSAPWKHTMEGPDDMPAHIKSSMIGCALTIPVTDGRLNMGTWQLGALVNIAGPGMLPPAGVPAPMLEPADVLDPPLPPIFAMRHSRSTGHTPMAFR